MKDIECRLAIEPLKNTSLTLLGMSQYYKPVMANKNSMT